MRNFSLEGFAGHFATAKWAFGLRIGTCVPGDGFAAGRLVGAKFFRRGTFFLHGGSFSCEIFSQGDPFFASGLFWLRNFHKENKFLCFCASLVPYGFSPLLLKMSIATHSLRKHPQSLFG